MNPATNRKPYISSPSNILFAIGFSAHSKECLCKKCFLFLQKNMLNRIKEWFHHKVLVRQSAWPERSLSVFFCAKQFRVQKLGYEKLGIIKLPCKDLTLPFFLSFLFSLSLSPSLSFSLSETVKISTAFDSSGQMILVNFLTLGKFKWTVLLLSLPEASRNF